MMGSVRTSEDRDRVEALRALALELGVQDQLDLRLDVSFKQLLEAYSTARAGIHTMWNEHFGE